MLFPSGGGGSPDTELSAAAALADAAANPTTAMVGANVMVWNGSTWDRVRGSTTRGMDTNLATALSSTIDSISTEGGKATYSASNQQTIAASGTNFAILVGSGTKTVRLRKIVIQPSATAAALQLIAVEKQSADDSGGTSTNPTKVPYDSANAAATAVVRSYSANPTVGTQVGSIGGGRYFCNAAASPISPATYEINYGGINEQSVVLRGTSEAVALWCAGSIASGLIVNFTFVWTEE